jgi:hypothetical protein
MFSSHVEYLGGTKEEADYVYYNADIINSRVSDVQNGLVVPDPQIRFNETRDSAIIKDASKYHFSIIRFTMDGPNRNLPLFIPEIVEGPTQNNVNLTPYQMALTYSQTWNTSAGPVSFNLAPVPTSLIYSPETQNPLLAPLPPTPVESQNINSRYYWVYTYGHMVDLMNITLRSAHEFLYHSLAAAWTNAGLDWVPWFGDVVFNFNSIVIDGGIYYQSLIANNIGNIPAASPAAWAVILPPAAVDPFPYPTLADFAAAVQPPQIFYEATTELFTIYADSDAFGERLEPFTPIAYAAGPPPVVGPQTKPTCRLFFNSNTFNLFANFNNIYYNGTTITGLPTPVPAGYTNEILFTNRFYQNVLDYRLPPYSGVPPLGYVPTAAQKVYWYTKQDYKSTDAIWSPIASIVFTSTLLPIRAEQTGQPVRITEDNLGDSAPTSKSAFQPIVTDIALDTSIDGADAYRSFIYYAPNAEYRMADFGPSKQEIRNIDVQVFWKARMNNELYPITIPNGGTVSLKMMFRHRDAAPGTSGVSKSGF